MPTSPQAIIDLAVQRSGLTTEQIDALVPVGRVAHADLWEVGQPAPLTGPAAGLVVFAIFTGDHHDPLNESIRGDARVYCVPGDDKPRGRRATVWAPSALPGFCRYTLSRVSPTLDRRDFPSADAFASEIGAEWADWSAALEEEEDETAAHVCAACGFETAVENDNEDEDEETDVEPSFCGHCGVRFTPLDPHMAAAASPGNQVQS
jgi:hypothetical protein